MSSRWELYVRTKILHRFFLLRLHLKRSCHLLHRTTIDFRYQVLIPSNGAEGVRNIWIFDRIVLSRFRITNDKSNLRRMLRDRIERIRFVFLSPAVIVSPSRFLIEKPMKIVGCQNFGNTLSLRTFVLVSYLRTTDLKLLYASYDENLIHTFLSTIRL